ncbi:11665_t:CDS:1, partial [Dentiscutata heterogama]
METKSFQMDNMSSLAKDEALQNKSDESSVSEDCEDIVFDVISKLQSPKT